MKKALALFIAVLFPLAAISAATVRGVELCSSEGTLVFNVDMPAFTVTHLANGETRIEMDGINYREQLGYPRLPMPTYTFALPPGSRLENVEVSGVRSELEGEYQIEASWPFVPLGASNRQVTDIYKTYEEIKARVYSGAEGFSGVMGEVNASGERREYSLVTVACHPFAYDPLTKKLSAARNVTIKIHYAPADPEHQEFVSRFISKGTLDSDVPGEVYNKDAARIWYRPEERLLANPRMLILTTNALKDTTSRYIYWRKSTGFDLGQVTKEEILAASAGADDPQKIRNWLRANAADYDYLFIIGNFADIPMRILSPFINGGTTDPTVAPIPSDIYYGDLSQEDKKGWDKDQDGYYGEGLTLAGLTDPQDAPDLEAELHVGRINTSNPALVPKILEKIWIFENNKTTAYKEASVLAGGILWFPNWNGSGTSGFDGAFYMEYLMNNGIIKSSSATTLYEQEGLRKSNYTPDVALTRDNLKNSLKNKDVGIFVENNHGWNKSFARCVWSSDDGDNIPEDAEFLWPDALTSSDAFSLTRATSNVAFLLSCLNGYPEDANCLAQALLNYSSAAVVAHTRSGLGRHGWTAPSSGGMNSLYTYLLDNYLKNSGTYNYVIGDAVDAARLQYFGTDYGSSRYVNSYEFTLFGDPAARHMGRDGKLPPINSVSETKPEAVPLALSFDSKLGISFSVPAEMNVRVEVWDASGRKVETLFSGTAKAGVETLQWDRTGLSSGPYFIILSAGNMTRSVKTVVLN